MKRLYVAALALGLQCQSAQAQTTLQSEDLVIDEFRDVALQFDGNWSARLPVIGGFDLENGATLETWIAPNWAKSPEEDPCIFSLLEDGATVLAVHVDNELNYIGLRSGNSYGGYSVDIDPSVLNHLAVATFGGYWDVYWNGEPSGMIALPVLSAQADELVVGGCGAEDQSYVGWISNFRLWNTIVFWDDV